MSWFKNLFTKNELHIHVNVPDTLEFTGEKDLLVKGEHTFFDFCHDKLKIYGSYETIIYQKPIMCSVTIPCTGNCLEFNELVKGVLDG